MTNKQLIASSPVACSSTLVLNLRAKVHILLYVNPLFDGRGYITEFFGQQGFVIAPLFFSYKNVDFLANRVTCKFNYVTSKYCFITLMLTVYSNLLDFCHCLWICLLTVIILAVFLLLTKVIHQPCQKAWYRFDTNVFMVFILPFIFMSMFNSLDHFTFDEPVLQNRLFKTPPRDFEHTNTNFTVCVIYAL